tara:strand:+ start:1110 stop:1634 length:525 start_codon:yes stop_codon:yes gene_type:complete
MAGPSGNAPDLSQLNEKERPRHTRTMMENVDREAKRNAELQMHMTLEKCINLMNYPFLPQSDLVMDAYQTLIALHDDPKSALYLSQLTALDKGESFYAQCVSQAVVLLWMSPDIPKGPEFESTMITFLARAVHNNTTTKAWMRRDLPDIMENLLRPRFMGNEDFRRLDNMLGID